MYCKGITDFEFHKHINGGLKELCLNHLFTDCIHRSFILSSHGRNESFLCFSG